MVRLIGLTGALDLAKRLVDENEGNLKNPENYINHIRCVYGISLEVLENIFSRYPKIPLPTGEISVAAVLHDIGRPLNKNQIFHELRGARYVKQNGLKDEISDSLEHIFRIAQTFRSHGFVYEHWHDAECLDLRTEFEPLDSSLLIPRNWNEAIVTYSDMAAGNNERISVEDRMSGLLLKYKNNPHFQDSVVVRAAEAANDRILRLAREVEALEQGKLSEEEILRFGFLK